MFTVNTRKVLRMTFRITMAMDHYGLTDVIYNAVFGTDRFVKLPSFRGQAVVFIASILALRE